MDINLQLKLGLVNQYLDGQISSIVKETFDDAIRNEALNEIDQRLERSFAIEKTKMIITIQTAYSEVFYSTDDIEGYTDVYVKKNLEHEIHNYIKEYKKRKGEYPDDWIRDINTGEYIWNEDVTSANDPDLPSGHEYVGKGNTAIRADFDKRAGWMEKIIASLL